MRSFFSSSPSARDDGAGGPGQGAAEEARRSGPQRAAEGLADEAATLARSALPGAPRARPPARTPRRRGALLSALTLAIALSTTLSEGEARAQALRDNHFSLDLFQGPILAPIGILGSAGAYAGYAEGLAAMVSNAAAPAVREPFSVTDLDYDVSGSVSIPIPLFDNSDFDNSGSIDFDYSNFVYVTFGGILQYGPFGAGINLEIQRYALTDQRGASTIVVVGKYHVLASVRLLDGQLMLGGGVRLASLGFDAREGMLTMLGAAPEVGLLVRPDWQNFRVGATVRLPVHGGSLEGGGSSVDARGVKRSGGLVIPEDVVLPWEIELGTALQIGPRPLNPRWADPRAEEAAIEAMLRRRRAEREVRREVELGRIDDLTARAARARELVAVEAAAEASDAREKQKALAHAKRDRLARFANWPREHLLLTADLLITGNVDRGVSIQGYLGQTRPDHRAGPSIVGSSGASVNFSPRIGIETEPIPGYVHTRVGTYYEPNRFGGAVGRQHFTFGADLRLFKTTWFGLTSEVIYKIQASADLAPRYQSVSLGAGVWH